MEQTTTCVCVIGVASNTNDELFVTLPGVIQELLPAYKKVRQHDYYSLYTPI